MSTQQDRLGEKIKRLDQRIKQERSSGRINKSTEGRWFTQGSDYVPLMQKSAPEKQPQEFVANADFGAVETVHKCAAA